MKERSSSQIIRVDGKNVFVEVVSSSFTIQKVQMNFIEYNEQTKKQTTRIDIFVDMWSALALAERIINGEFFRMVNKAKNENSFEGKVISAYTSYFSNMGGLSEPRVEEKFETLKKQHPFLEKGMALSRQFKIQVGNKMPWVLRAECGIGKCSESGLIMPQGASKQCVNIPVDTDSLIKIAIAIKYSCNAYLNQYYAKYADKLFPKDTVRTYTPQ